MTVGCKFWVQRVFLVNRRCTVTNRSRQSRCLFICQQVVTKQVESESTSVDVTLPYINSGKLAQPEINKAALELEKHPKYRLFVGAPEPQGTTWNKALKGYNFALFSSSAESVSVCLFTEEDLQQGVATEEIVLNPQKNKTGSIWHICIVGLDPTLLYGYRLSGPNQDDPNQDEVGSAAGHRFNKDEIMLDPYAIAVLSRRRFTELGQQLAGKELSMTWAQAACALPQQQTSGGKAVQFDWQGDKSLGLPMENLIIYETHVRGFTKHPLSNVASPGTYAGLIQRLDYLKDLGINCIELLPIFDFNELEYYQEDSEIERYNYWGYSTVNFFAPMSRFSAGISEGENALSAVTEVKMLVREAHKRGMEVILDVVFNHSAEGNENGPTINFRGIDNRIYYMLASGGEYYNYSGCGNTINCNHPQVRSFILECLKYWVKEYHMDGFRFDLAPILTRANSLFHESDYVGGGSGEPTGTPLSNPPLIESISNDPLLKNTKLIAEAWDADGLNQLGAFPHYGGRWAEWNGNFRDTVRQFIKGTDGQWAGKFADAICGSPGLFLESNPHDGDWWGNNGGRQWKGGRQPLHSVNFVTAHDGFTLMDLVSYNEKHNIGNGEDNRDGESHNLSWNCGVEGPTQDSKVIGLRARQIRNFAMALFLSQGVPMLIMGDEYGHSKGGNNNTYCHDTILNWFDWGKATRDPTGFRRFVKLLINFRKNRPQLHQKFYIQSPGIVFHGAQDPAAPDWSDSSRFVAFTLQGGKTENSLYVAFNSAHTPQAVNLPKIDGRQWKIIADTGKPAPFDFLQEDVSLSKQEIDQIYETLSMWTDNGQYPMLPWSAILMESVPFTSIATTQKWDQRQKSWQMPQIQEPPINLSPESSTQHQQHPNLAKQSSEQSGRVQINKKQKGEEIGQQLLKNQLQNTQAQLSQAQQKNDLVDQGQNDDKQQGEKIGKQLLKNQLENISPQSSVIFNARNLTENAQSDKKQQEEEIQQKPINWLKSKFIPSQESPSQPQNVDVSSSSEQSLNNGEQFGEQNGIEQFKNLLENTPIQPNQKVSDLSAEEEKQEVDSEKNSDKGGAVDFDAMQAELEKNRKLRQKLGMIPRDDV